MHTVSILDSRASGCVKDTHIQAFLNDITGRRGMSGPHKLPFITGMGIQTYQTVAPGNLFHIPFGGWEVTAWSNFHWSQWWGLLGLYQGPIVVRIRFKPFDLNVRLVSFLKICRLCLTKRTMFRRRLKATWSTEIFCIQTMGFNVLWLAR